MYSPAKYGILTELLPPEKLVVANSWMEGTTVAAIVLGAIIGGALINPQLAESTLAQPRHGRPAHRPQIRDRRHHRHVPGRGRHQSVHPAPADRPQTSQQIARCSSCTISGTASPCCGATRSGQVSLAVTTLFWGVGATLRLLIIEWAALNLKFSLGQATQLTAATAVGIASAPSSPANTSASNTPSAPCPPASCSALIPVSLIWVESLDPGGDPARSCSASLAAFFVVPMNALLQHRGHLLMGAGHSIAQQNFNENISILLLTGGLRPDGPR